MGQKHKIFNDPLYGLIDFPFEIVYKLIDHRYFQRLRRIRQLGLSSYVYPGATHTRFHHAIGVTHLANQVVRNLKEKGVKITKKEHEGLCIAALLHDIGHGPFSHVLEHTFLDKRHEALTLDIMELLDIEYDGKLRIAIEIFKGEYPKPFLTQIIMGQLDVDRLDYLTRDSYYTGVIEGQVGYNRILKMLNVVKNKLVVEEKGVYSVEKFLMARRFMYRQVYLHKVVILLDEMLKSFLERYVELFSTNKLNRSNTLISLLELKNNDPNNHKKQLETYLKLDDIDIFYILKEEMFGNDRILSYFSESLLNRRLFSIKFTDNPILCDFVNEARHNVAKALKYTFEETKYFVRSGYIQNAASKEEEQVEIVTKRKKVKPISIYIQDYVLKNNEKIYYVCQIKNNA